MKIIIDKAKGVAILVGLSIFLILLLPTFIIAGVLDGVKEWAKFPAAALTFVRSL